MEKGKKIVIGGVIAIIAIAAVIAGYYLTLPSLGPLPPGEPPEWKVKVTGDVEKEKTWTLKEMTEMPLTNVTHTIKEEKATYLGVTLLEFCDRSGMLWDAGPIDIIASDGYTKTINVWQAWNSTQYPGREVILAFVKDGKWMTNETGGPVQLIAPEFETKYQVKGVAEIRIGLWTIDVSGAVSNPLVVTGKNITTFEVKTVRAAFAPGGEPQRTSNWTGVLLWDILQASSMSEVAKTIRIVAIDGYSREFTPTQIKDLGMLIGYKENDADLSRDAGRPFRLMIPVEEFKWGQYWVRWVTQIEVSE